jgi:hypothetical protein
MNDPKRIKSTFYTYRNKNKVFITLDRFYILNSNEELKSLVSSLLKTDAAVHHSSNIIRESGEGNFPFAIELQENVNEAVLIEVSVEMVKKIMTQSKMNKTFSVSK